MPRSLSPLLFLLSAIVGTASWLVPDHYYPWTSFSQDFASFVALWLLLAGTALWPGSKGVKAPLIAIIAATVGLLPIAQALTGKIYFAGDGWIAAAYLVGLAAACLVGFALGRDTPEGLATTLAWMVLSGALISVGVALCQWLQLDATGVLATDLLAGMPPYANLAQPNNLATLLCWGIAGLLYLRSRSRLGAVGASLLGLVLALGLAMAQSRTTWIGAGFLLFWWSVHRRLIPNISGQVLLGAVIVYAALAYWWPDIDRSVWITTPEVQRSLAIGPRSIIWTQLIDAALRSPWLGYGWNQVGVAQLLVGSEYPPSLMTEHSHNLLLDLALWCGIPIALLLTIGVGMWLLIRAIRCRTQEGWFALLAIGFVLIHAMLEYPLEYAYFLLPTGVLLGLLDADYGKGLQIRCPPMLVWTVWAAGGAFMGTVWHEYRIIDEDYRLMRFETMRIGQLKAQHAAPDVVVLSQLREFIRFARSRAHENMSPEDIEWMIHVAHRFPYPPSLFRATLALGLNDRFDEARLELQRIRQLHGEKNYREAIESLRSMSSSHRALANLP